MYKIFVSGTNDLPGTPDPMEDYSIRYANATVAQIDEVEVLITGRQFGSTLVTSAMLLAAAILA
jgi:hypothetical protein